METTQDLIEELQTCLDEISNPSSDNTDSVEWSNRAAEAGRSLIGRSISADVFWERTKRTITLSGEVSQIIGDKVYFESSFGLVEGDVFTMSEITNN